MLTLIVMLRPSTYFDPKERCWWTPILCDQCGGYRHDLPLRDEAASDEAVFLAQAAHNYPGCLGCEGNYWRGHAIGESDNGIIWWDARSRQWMLWMAVEDIPLGVALPLGVRYSGARDTAEVAARLLMGKNPLPLRIFDAGTEPDSGLPHLTPNTDGGFELWLPCFECGGTTIPLLDNKTVLTAALESLECFGWFAISGCPNCRTFREHNPEMAEQKPLTTWYSTLLNDWVVRTPDGEGNLCVRALEIGHYGASNEEVAAATQRLLLAETPREYNS